MRGKGCKSRVRILERTFGSTSVFVKDAMGLGFGCNLGLARLLDGHCTSLRFEFASRALRAVLTEDYEPAPIKRSHVGNHQTMSSATSP